MTYSVRMPFFCCWFGLVFFFHSFGAKGCGISLHVQQSGDKTGFFY